MIDETARPRVDRVYPRGCDLIGGDMVHDNSAIVHRWFEDVWNGRRAEVIDELMTAESVCLTDDGPMRGPLEFRQRQYDPFLAAFPDLRVEVEALITQGEHVIVRWTATGTHSGGGLGFPATRAAVAFRGISWIIVRGGRMMEGWQSSNISEVIRGLSAQSTV